MSRETVRIHVVFPSELIEAVDRFVGRDERNNVIVQAVAAKVEREWLGKALAETAGVLSAEDYPEWSTPEKTSAWVRALRDPDRRPPE